MVTYPASDCYQVASVQTLITEAASYGPAGHSYSPVTQLREARHADLSSGAILMKIASVRVVHCSQKRPRTEDSSSIAGGTEVHPHLNNHSPQPSQAGSVHISATWSGLSEPGIEGHSSPGASLSPCLSQGYRLKLPSWMYITQCCQIHCEPRLEGSSSPIQVVLRCQPQHRHGPQHLARFVCSISTSGPVISGMQPGPGHVICVQRSQPWTKNAARVTVALASASAV